MNNHQSSTHKGLRIFRFCIVSWKDEREPSIKHSMGRKIGVVQKFTGIRNLGQNWWWTNGVRVENFPGFNTLQLSQEVQELLLRLNETQENFTGKITFMSMFNDNLMVIKRQQERMRFKCSTRFSICKKIRSRTMVISLSWFREKKWYSISEDSPQGDWDKTEKMMVTLAESGHPVFRVTSPLSRSQLKSKGGGKLSIHYCADLESITTVFRTITSVNQLSLHGAVAEMCEECESLHDRSGQPDMVMGQSIVLSEIQTEVPLDCDEPVYQNFVLQQCEERIERLSQTDRVSEFCMLWEDSRVPRLCQAWSRQTRLWIVMILLIKHFYCKDTENELKSYHNKTDWAIFVLMQDSWQRLTSDSISGRKILHNSHNSQIQWPVVSTLCQETKIHLTREVGSEGTPKLCPY